MGSANCILRTHLDQPEAQPRAVNVLPFRLRLLEFFGRARVPEVQPGGRFLDPVPDPPDDQDGMDDDWHEAREYIEISDSDTDAAEDGQEDDQQYRPGPKTRALLSVDPPPVAPRQRRPGSNIVLLDDEDSESEDDSDIDRGIIAGPSRIKRSASPQPRLDNDPANPPEVETLAQCVPEVASLFPGICLDYVGELYDTVAQSSRGLVSHILDKTEQGFKYPLARDVKQTKKRKRDIDEDEEAALKYRDANLIMDQSKGTKKVIQDILAAEFNTIPINFISICLKQSQNQLFSTYRVLEEAQRTWDADDPPYNKLKVFRRPASQAADDPLVEAMIKGVTPEEKSDILQQFKLARRIRRKADVKRAADLQLERDEELNTKKAEAEGTIGECGCCCGDFPLNRMISCDNEGIGHFFCRDCARQAAETEIGKSKWELRCMSMDGCESGFSSSQRSLFLDAKTITALERNELEANLRLAGIENLASCPFCPYAAEYPPIDVDREFRCEREDCEKVSCRICKQESHLPRTCDEHARENGLSVRRQIEEAMSQALIRRCNKCDTPFVKLEGCNKMTCTRNGCGNIQCYVCSKTCSYDHFNDTNRGGKVGNCPLFESTVERHEEEVNNAEKAALEKVRAEHPEFTEEDLRIRVSETVQQDEAARRAGDPARPVPVPIPRRAPSQQLYFPNPNPPQGNGWPVFGPHMPFYGPYMPGQPVPNPQAINRPLNLDVFQPAPPQRAIPMIAYGGENAAEAQRQEQEIFRQMQAQRQAAEAQLQMQRQMQMQRHAVEVQLQMQRQMLYAEQARLARERFKRRPNFANVQEDAEINQAQQARLQHAEALLRRPVANPQEAIVPAQEPRNLEGQNRRDAHRLLLQAAADAMKVQEPQNPWADEVAQGAGNVLAAAPPARLNLQNRDKVLAEPGARGLLPPVPAPSRVNPQPEKNERARRAAEELERLRKQQNDELALPLAGHTPAGLAARMSRREEIAHELVRARLKLQVAQQQEDLRPIGAERRGIKKIMSGRR